MKEKRKHTKKRKLSYDNINYKEQQMQIRIIAREDEKDPAACKPLLLTWSPT